MKQVLVEKRDGSKEEYDVSKTKQSIALACANTVANPLILESKLSQTIKNGMKTRDIQKNIIDQAVQLASRENPEWAQVAGNAYAMDEWADFKLRGKNLKEVITYNIQHGQYDSKLLDYYSEEDLIALDNMLNFDYDLNHSHSSLVVARKKFLGKFELNQHMHMVNAMRIGTQEAENDRLEFVSDMYKILAERKISLATPFMANLRKGGNISSCFILAIEDDLDSIFKNAHRVAKISKNGGGLGIYLGKIRAKGSKVNGFDNAAGTIVQWVKILNDILVAVNQGGKRAGAGTVALPIWHNDIFDFLDMQTEHGDLRLKAFDVFPQIVIPDLFYERDKAGLPWVTFCPYEVKQKLGIEMYGLWGTAFNEAYEKIEQAVLAGKLKISRVVPNARNVFKTFMKVQFETGLPFITNIDTINAENPNKHDKHDNSVPFIPCVNLCTESFSNVAPDVYGHVCNLASINLGNIKGLDELGNISRLATKILNYGIALTINPSKITDSHNDRYRTIGIGVMGLHDYLAREKLSFGDLDKIRLLQECIQYNAILESTNLAKTRGSFKAFDNSEWKTGARINRFKMHASGKFDWDFAQEQINTHGMFNSQLTSPAPTTSTSIYQDASASFLPVFEAYFRDDNKHGSMVQVARYFAKHKEGYAKTLNDFSATEIIDVATELQKFIDTGISLELSFDQNKPGFKAKDLYDAIHYAHDKDAKSIYYIRTVKKNAAIDETACEGCSG